MAQGRVTRAGVYVESGGREARVTRSGVYIESKPVPAGRVTRAGFYVEYLIEQEVVANQAGAVKAAGRRHLHTMLPEERSGYAFDPQDSWWSVVVPEPTKNLLTDPSFESSVPSGGNASGWDSGPFQHTTAPYATAGRTSCRLPLAAASDGWIREGFVADGDGPHTFSCDVFLYVGMSIRLELRDQSASDVYASKAYVADKTGWNRYYVTGVIPDVAFHAYLHVLQAGQQIDVYTDAWQAEFKPYPTSYCDGDMISISDPLPERSYIWLGEPHASKSMRLDTAGEGGKMTSLTEKVGFLTTSIQGLGTGDIESHYAAYGSIRQQRYLYTDDNPRDFTIIGRLFGCDIGPLSKVRKELIRLLRHDNTVKRRQVDLVYQPVDDAGRPYGDPMRIRCVYTSGLGGNITNLYQETIPLQFHAADPFIYEMHGTTRPLQVPSAWTNNGVWYRRGDGHWDTLTAGATTGDINACIFRSDGTIVIGGNFTQLCGDAVSYLAYWLNTVFVQIAALDGQVKGLVRAGPYNFGGYYVWGDFTLDNVTNCRRVAFGGLSSVAELGSGLNGSPNAGVVSPSGIFYIGGAFTADNSANTLNYIAYHDPSIGLGSLSPIGDGSGIAGFADEVLALVVGRDNYLYVGGTFNTDANGTPMQGIARLNLSKWEGNLANATFEPLPGTDAQEVHNMAVGRDGMIYAYGQINLQWSIWRFTGLTWERIGRTAVMPDTKLWFDQQGMGWVAGSNQQIPNVAQGFYRMIGGNNFLPVPVATDFDNDGYPVDMDFYGDGEIIAVWKEETGAVEGRGSFSIDVEYDGSAYVRPTICLKGPMTLMSVINETTGAEIWFRHGDEAIATVAADETLFVELSTGRPRVYSDRRSFLINLLNLPATTAARFWLQPEETNEISVYVKGTTGDSKAYLTWTNRHRSIDFSAY